MQNLKNQSEIQMENRIQKLKEILKRASVDAFLIEDPINLFYLTGMELSCGKLLVTQKNALLLVDGRYFEICEREAPCAIQLLEKESLMHLFLSKEYAFIKTVGFDSETVPHKTFLDLEKLFQKIKEQSSGRSNIKLVALDNIVKVLRMIKDDDEINILKESAILCSSGFDYICSSLKEGVQEIEIAFELEQYVKKKGAQKMAFDPIIAFGSNSSMPHYRTGNKKLEKGDVVLIDIGVTYKNYQSDMTRMVFFGKPQEEISIIHSIVERAQALSLEICKPGTLIKDIDAKAREFIQEQGYGEHFTHGIGHGVGLEVHELPNMRYQSSLASQKLEPGMVITIEPGIYLPKIGGVRIEDTILITDTGYESLTKRATKPVLL